MPATPDPDLSLSVLHILHLAQTEHAPSITWHCNAESFKHVKPPSSMSCLLHIPHRYIHEFLILANDGQELRPHLRHFLMLQVDIQRGRNICDIFSGHIIKDTIRAEGDQFWHLVAMGEYQGSGDVAELENARVGILENSLDRAWVNIVDAELRIATLAKTALQFSLPHSRRGRQDRTVALELRAAARHHAIGEAVIVPQSVLNLPTALDRILLRRMEVLNLDNGIAVLQNHTQGT